MLSDPLDIVFRLEMRFGIELPLDCLREARTVEGLADVVCQRLAAQGIVELDGDAPGLSEGELTELALQWLRQELLVHVSTASQHLTGDTPAAEAIPISRRRYLWRIWEQQGLKLPSLLPPEPATRFAVFSSFVRGVLAAAVLFPLIGFAAIMVGVVVWLLSLISTGMILYQWFAWRLPVATCGELARTIVLHNLNRFTGQWRRKLSRGDVLRIMREAIANVTAAPIEKIKPEAEVLRLLQ